MLSQERQTRRLGISAVPPGWIMTTVGEACSIRNELRLPLAVEVRNGMKGPYPYYGPTGILDLITEYRVEGDFALIGEDGDHFLDTETKPQTIRVSGQFNVNNHAHIIGSGPNCDVDWFFYFFQYRDIFHSLTRQGAGRFKLTKTALEKLPILLPSLSEQRKITQILGAWDSAIENLVALRSAKSRAFIAARQAAFGLNGIAQTRWACARLEEISTRVRRQSDDSDHPVMTISGKLGFRRQDEKFDRFMAGQSVENYILLKRGEFAYNKGNSKTYPQGCIYRLEQDTALVPFVYFAFALRDDLNGEFYCHLFEAGFLNHQLARLINSGVRNDGHLNLYAHDFFSCKLPVPPRPEQDRMAEFFNLAKQELSAIDRQIEAVKRQKRGLMQKLLTGEWRVKPGGGHV
jgi:type I restriction enzyme S subunit